MPSRYFISKTYYILRILYIYVMQFNFIYVLLCCMCHQRKTASSIFAQEIYFA